MTVTWDAEKEVLTVKGEREIRYSGALLQAMDRPTPPGKAFRVAHGDDGLVITQMVSVKD